MTVEGEPIISYKGGIDGFEATAVESDEKIDTTRYHPKFFVTDDICIGLQILDYTTIPMLASLIYLDHVTKIGILKPAL